MALILIPIAIHTPASGPGKALMVASVLFACGRDETAEPPADVTMTEQAGAGSPSDVAFRVNVLGVTTIFTFPVSMCVNRYSGTAWFPLNLTREYVPAGIWAVGVRNANGASKRNALSA